MDHNQIKNLPVIRLFRGNRTAVLVRAAILTALIALIDWHFKDNISFGVFYLFPMLIMGGHLTLFQIGAMAALCTGLTELFAAFPWAMTVGISRLVLTFTAFYGAGFVGMASARSRRAAGRALEELKREAELRRKSEEQLHVLISNSPVAIFTLNGAGELQMANEAAHQLFGIENGKLEGRAIGQFFPALATVPASQEAPFFHTEMECRGHRLNGEVFLAHIWFSTYQTMSGPRLAAVVFDTSEELRNRVEFNLQQLQAGSKILMKAVCHEIRNIAGAVGLVHAKLTRNNLLEGSDDFRALGTLVQALEKMAGLELRDTTGGMAESIDVNSILEELRIVIEPSFHDAGIGMKWDGLQGLPRVKADPQALLQVFLNLAKNCLRALEGRTIKQFIVQAEADVNSVKIQFIDTGPGVAEPERLFAPFQKGAHNSGLGLYLSRAFLRAFEGDIKYEAQPEGSCFVVTLSLAPQHSRILGRTSNGAD